MTQKTIIAAFAAALFAAPAFAAEEYEAAAQVYDLTVSIKTTQAAKAKLSPKKNPFITDGTVQTVYRKQGTQKWTGVLWGCECEAVMGQWGLINGGSTVAGAAIWNTALVVGGYVLGENWHIVEANVGIATKVVIVLVVLAAVVWVALRLRKNREKQRNGSGE